MTRLATNKPPANRTARPANRAIIIHIRDLDDDELPEVDASAITCFSQAGTVRPVFSVADKRLTSARMPPGCALSVPVLRFRPHFSGAGRVGLLLHADKTPGFFPPLQFLLRLGTPVGAGLAPPAGAN